MITEILLSVGFFVIGAVTGAVCAACKLGKAIVEVSKMYVEETGNDFVAWIKHKDADIKIAKLYELQK